jgi:dipeptidyl aminopeptidase/acylaminoacyl peptidase
MGGAIALTHVQGQLSDLRFSPDGKSLAVLFVKGSTQETGALVAYKPDSGVVGETPEEQRIAVIDVATHAFREVSPPNLFIYDYDWAPDGKSFAVEAATGSGTNNYWIAELDRIDLASGASKRLWKPSLQLATPRFSPDGKLVAVIHGLMSDEGSNGGDVYVVPAEGGEARNLTPGMAASAKSLHWTSGGEILFVEDVDGERGIAKVSTTGTLKSVRKAPESLSPFQVSKDGTLAIAARESFGAPPEVYAGPIDSMTPLTHVNASVHPFWGDAKSVHVESDGLNVQGWLLPPKDVAPGRRYPLVVIAHGGPSGAVVPSWPTRWTAVLPSRGYFVFLPNFRGSYGGGEAFTQGNVKDFGYGDLRDILAGLDEVLKTEPIDPDRLGIAGWSYGGYMTMWAVTQTRRFKAAVAGAGIMDWQSYYGQNRIDTWMLPFFGASVYDDPWIYARSSPVTFIKAVKTPTLVLHGDRDSEVPTPQGYEFWHALRTLGVPTELVIYEGEGHGIRKKEHRQDLMERSLGWFDKYLAPQGTGGKTSSSEETSKR